MSDEFFKKIDVFTGPYLYGHGLEGGVWLGYLLSEDGGPNLMSLEESWKGYWGLPRRESSRARSRPDYRNGGCYLFCGEEPELNGNFMKNLTNFLDRLNGTYGDYYRYIFWFENPNSDDLKGQYIPIKKKSDDRGQVVSINRQDWITLRNIQIRLSQGVEISLDSENVQFLLQQLPGVDIKLYNTIGPIFFGKVAPNDDTPYVCIPLTGTGPGALKFDASLRVDAQVNEFEIARVSLKYFYKNEAEDICSQLYPVFDLPASNPILFRVSLDPMHPLDHARSNFTFVGYGGILPPSFTTWFRLDLGHVITLTPKPNESSLVLSADKTRLQEAKPQNDTFYLTLSGDYIIGLEDPSKFHPTADRPLPQLLCGLSGLESISFHLNDVVTFCPDREAYAPVFPIKEATLDDPDPSESKPLLDGTYTTSWMKVTSPSKDEMNVYFSQPQGYPLYAKNHGTNIGFLGHHQTSSAQLGDNVAYPLVPYASMKGDSGGGESVSNDDIPQFEFHIISPFRRDQILNKDEAELAGCRPATEGEPSEPTPATTPQGFISHVRADGSWSSLLLARNVERDESLQFEDLNPSLQNSFQTNQLFLVVTDPIDKLNLKSMKSNNLSGSGSDQTTFDNLISIGDWPFKINVGKDNSFNDYRNVLIFKFCEGKLADRVTNPKKWTDADKFNDASIGGPEAVSQWLQDYIANAERQEGDYFKHFKTIINDAKWNGILALKVDISLDQFPPQLEGLLGGIDLDRFNVHHLGIEGSKIDGETVEIKETSSMFGLIYYADPNYDGSGSPIPPAPGEDYDFAVLTLKVLFENSAIKDFESLAQLTMNKIFDYQVTTTGDPKNLYNAILLNGSCQRHGDETVYVLDTVDDNSFYFDSNVLHKVEITKAQFNTMGKNKINGGESGDENDDRMEVSTRFEFTGFIDFEILKEKKGEELRNFDVFSFGNDDGKDDPRKGLSFSGLGLNMTFPEDEPSKKEFAFDPSKIAFSLEKSTPRETSLFEDFALVFEGFVSGTSETKTADGGFLQVKTALKQAGPSGTWQGFKFRLNMGTPGELAGKVSLTSSLLLAWSAGSSSDSESYNVFIGIKLPGTGGGAKLLDLQGVLKLSIGDVRLAYMKDDTGEKEAFLLTLTDIALKFLGIAKLPPGGSTSFYLFGDSAAKARGCGLGWYAMYRKDAKGKA